MSSSDKIDPDATQFPLEDKTPFAEDDKVDPSSFSSIVWATLRHLSLDSLTKDYCSRQSLMTSIGVGGAVFMIKTMVNLGHRRNEILKAEKFAMSMRHRNPGRPIKLPSGVGVQGKKASGVKNRTSTEEPSPISVPKQRNYVLNAANWAVGSFAFTSIVFMEICRSRKAAESRKIAELLEAQKKLREKEAAAKKKKDAFAPLPPPPSEPKKEESGEQKSLWKRWV